MVLWKRLEPRPEALTKLLLSRMPFHPSQFSSTPRNPRAGAKFRGFSGFGTAQIWVFFGANGVLWWISFDLFLVFDMFWLMDLNLDCPHFTCCNIDFVLCIGSVSACCIPCPKEERNTTWQRLWIYEIPVNKDKNQRFWMWTPGDSVLVNLRNAEAMKSSPSTWTWTTPWNLGCCLSPLFTMMGPSFTNGPYKVNDNVKICIDVLNTW